MRDGVGVREIEQRVADYKSSTRVGKKRGRKAISAAGKALNGALRELRKALELLPQAEQDLLKSAAVGLEAALARTKA